MDTEEAEADEGLPFFASQEDDYAADAEWEQHAGDDCQGSGRHSMASKRHAPWNPRLPMSPIQEGRLKDLGSPGQTGDLIAAVAANSGSQPPGNKGPQEEQLDNEISRLQQELQQARSQLESQTAGLQAALEGFEARNRCLQEAAGTASLEVAALRAANWDLQQQLALLQGQQQQGGSACNSPRTAQQQQQQQQQQQVAVGSAIAAVALKLRLQRNPLYSAVQQLQQPSALHPGAAHEQVNPLYSAGAPSSIVTASCSIRKPGPLQVPESPSFSSGEEQQGGAATEGCGSCTAAAGPVVVATDDTPASSPTFGQPQGKRAMQVALEARRVEVRMLREDARVKQEELLRALSEIQASHQQCEDLRREADNLAKQLELTAEALETKDAELEVLRCELEQRDGMLQELQVSAMCEQEVQEKVVGLHNVLVEMRDRQLERLRDEVEAKSEKISSLQAEQRQLREQAERQAEQLARLEARLGEMGALREELQQALQARAELQSKLQLAIQEACEEKLNLSSQVAGLQEQLAEVQQAADALGADAEAKRAAAALEAGRAEQLAAKVAQLSDDLAASQSSQEELKQQLEEASAQARRAGELQAQLEAAKRPAPAAQAAVTPSQRRPAARTHTPRQVVTQKVKQLEGQLAEAMERERKSSVRVHTLTEVVRIKDAAVAKLTAELGGARRQLDEMRGQLAEALALAEADFHLAEVQRQLTRTHSELTELVPPPPPAAPEADAADAAGEAAAGAQEGGSSSDDARARAREQQLEQQAAQWELEFQARCAGASCAALVLAAAGGARQEGEVRRLQQRVDELQQRVNSLQKQRLTSMKQVQSLRHDLAEAELLLAPLCTSLNASLNASPVKLGDPSDPEAASPEPGQELDLSVASAVAWLQELQEQRGVSICSTPQRGTAGAAPAPAPSRLALRIQHLMQELNFARSVAYSQGMQQQQYQQLCELAEGDEDLLLLEDCEAGEAEGGGNANRANQLLQRLQRLEEEVESAPVWRSISASAAGVGLAQLAREAGAAAGQQGGSQAGGRVMVCVQARDSASEMHSPADMGAVSSPYFGQRLTLTPAKPPPSAQATPSRRPAASPLPVLEVLRSCEVRPQSYPLLDIPASPSRQLCLDFDAVCLADAAGAGAAAAADDVCMLGSPCQPGEAQPSSFPLLDVQDSPSLQTAAGGFEGCLPGARVTPQRRTPPLPAALPGHPLSPTSSACCSLASKHDWGQEQQGSTHMVTSVGSAEAGASALTLESSTSELAESKLLETSPQQQ